MNSPSASSTAATRVPQADRTRAMRARLLEATVELLVERGFAGTSTTLVSDRAGVSRGAQLHHFPTKNDLVVAAVEHLTERRGAELAEAVAHLPKGGRRTRAVVEDAEGEVTDARLPSDKQTVKPDFYWTRTTVPGAKQAELDPSQSSPGGVVARQA